MMRGGQQEGPPLLLLCPTSAAEGRAGQSLGTFITTDSDTTGPGAGHKTRTVRASWSRE